MIYMTECRTFEDRAVADRHEEILAGLANERAHSRFRIWRGNPHQGYQLDPVQWTYDGRGGMVLIRGCESRAFI